MKRTTAILRLYAAQDGRCFYCRDSVSLDNMTRDHMIPRKRSGGGMDKKNIVLACQDCNVAKGHRKPTDIELERAAAIFAKAEKSDEIDPPSTTIAPSWHQVIHRAGRA